MHVDSQGLIYHPYLHSWKPQQSALVELIGYLCSVFGKDPPLYASKKQSQPQQHQQQQQPIQQIQKPIISPQPPAYKPIQQQQQQQPQPQAIIQQQPPKQIQKQEEINNNKQKLETKLREYLQKIYDKENEQLNALASAQKQLENHVTTISSIRDKQNNEKDLLLQRRQNLQIKIEASEQWLKQNENNNDSSMDINKIVIASDTWSQQCIDATSMDFAITDVILELDRCLEDETIKLETYLKQISKLAREQFANKALAKAVFKKQNDLVLMNQHR